MTSIGSVGRLNRSRRASPGLVVVVPLFLLAAACGSNMGNPNSAASDSTALSANPKPGTQYSLEFIDIPGSVRSFILDINNAGVAVGNSTDSSGVSHGIILKRNQLTSFDAPGSSSTSFTDINDSGAIVGWFNDVSGIQHGLKLLPDMSMTVVDFPGAVNSAATSINNRGDVIGTYGPTIDEGVGFLLSDGRFTSLVDPPGAAPLTTVPWGINDLGTIVGSFTDTAGTGQGFVLRGTTYTILNPLNGGSNTELSKVNDRGEAFGWNEAGGFIINTNDGVFSPFACPARLPIRALGINNRGQLTGGCRTVAGGPFQGFIATPVRSDD